MFTRTKDMRSRINYDLEVLSQSNNYTFGAPGTGPNPEYITNPEIRLEKWGGNLRTNALNLEHDLFGQTRKLNRDDIKLNNYVGKSVSTSEKSYNTKEIKNENQRLILNHVDSREQGIGDMSTSTWHKQSSRLTRIKFCVELSSNNSFLLI